MYDGGLPAQLDIIDLENCLADLCSSEEFDVESYRMWLVLLRKRSLKVRGNDLENTSSDISAIWNYGASARR